MVFIYFCFISSGHAHSQVPEMLLMHLAFLGVVGTAYPHNARESLYSPSVSHCWPRHPVPCKVFHRRVQGQERTSMENAGFLQILCAVWRLEFWDSKGRTWISSTLRERQQKRTHMLFLKGGSMDIGV